MKNPTRTNLILRSGLVLALAILFPHQSPSAEPTKEKKMDVLAAALTRMVAQPPAVKAPKTKENAVMIKGTDAKPADTGKAALEASKLMAVRQSDRTLFWPW